VKRGPVLFAAGVLVMVWLIREPLFGLGSWRGWAKPVRVEVLNGSGVFRAGQRAAELLREGGFDVVDIRNADRSDYQETLVLDRVGVSRHAKAVARELGVRSTTQQKNEDLLLEVTVILGRDVALELEGGIP
jgi:hypothetical protein